MAHTTIQGLHQDYPNLASLEEKIQKSCCGWNQVRPDPPITAQDVSVNFCFDQLPTEEGTVIISVEGVSFPDTLTVDQRDHFAMTICEEIRSYICEHFASEGNDKYKRIEVSVNKESDFPTGKFCWSLIMGHYCLGVSGTL